MAKPEDQDRFEAVFEASPFALAVSRVSDGATVGVNAAFERLLGSSRAATIGRTILDLVPYDDESRALVAAAMRERRSLHDIECAHRMQAGEERILSIGVTPIQVGDDDHVLTTIDDVTERRRAQDALRDSEARYRSIVETTAEGVIIGRPDGVIVYANQQMADMLGCSVDELTGRSGLDFVFPDWEMQVIENRAALDSGSVLRGEMKLRRKDGGALWTWFSSSAMVDQSGAHVANLTMHTDTTKRRHAEEALRDSEVAKAAQQERNHLARELHDSVTQALFAAALRMEALQRSSGQLLPEVAAALEDVERLNRGALAQMRTMLLELRGETIEDVPLELLLRHLTEATQSRARVSVHLSITGAASLPPHVHVAAFRIAQEALNNVVRHAHAGTARVELELGPGGLRLIVADDGCGYDPSRPVDSSHLGLVSMRERAADVGARLDVTSCPGGGTRVELEWPSGGDRG
jgi:PAS domain S-box-containing protein